MERAYNFSAGPSMLPLSVLERAQKELVIYKNSGMSVMEMSHRSAPYQEIIDRAEAALRRIMNISDEYAVLFLQGGASLQFSMLPMNLAKRGDTVDYAVTGQFAEKAYTEGKRWCSANAVTSSKGDNFTFIPKLDASLLTKGAKYLHITVNNTIYGTCYNELPDVGDVPLVCDMSSVILGKEYDVNRFSLIYAGAQKNMGPAGLTVVIIKKSLLDGEREELVPPMLNYSVMAKNGSMYNTPPCYSIYIAGLVYEWVETMGGVAAMQKRNEEKAKLLYDAIEDSSLFQSPVAVGDRSIMNVTFTLKDESLTSEFLDMTKKRGMTNLKGHRSVGGCRASIYNAMPYEGVEALVTCMKDFETGKRD